MPKSHIVIERPEYFDGRRISSEAGPALILIRGTSHGEWADPGSPFRTRVLERAGAVVVGTVFGPEPLLFPRRAWNRIGDEIAALLEHGAFHLLAHSHGLQPAAIAIAQASAAGLVSVSGPVRSEMKATYQEAARRCTRVTQIADAGTDWTQIGGQYFMRSVLGIRSREYPAAANVTNLRVPDVGHSGLLYDGTKFQQARDLIVPAL